MTPRTLATYAALWLLIASSVAVGVLVGSLLAGNVSAARPAQDSRATDSPRWYDGGPGHPAVSGLPALVGQPDSHPGAPTASPVPGRITPSPTVTGSSPESTRKTRTANTLRGIASFMAPSYGAAYLALPDGPGQRVTICGPAACIVRTSNDAGPDLAMQRAGRVADLSFRDFALVCGCDPWIVGLVRVEVTP